MEARGRLKQSNRPMIMHLWLGMTDIFGPRAPQHWRILERALAENQVDDLLGSLRHRRKFPAGADRETPSACRTKNFRAERLAHSPLRMDGVHQLLFVHAILARICSRPARSGENGGYFVFTGMEHSQHEAGPLAVIDLIDRVLAPANGTGQIEKLPLLGDDEFWLIKEVAGTAPARPPP